MPKRASEEIRQLWREKILKQRESGLSIKSWCQQNLIAAHAFLYWQNKLFPKGSLARSDFREIQEHQEAWLPRNKIGISLEYKGICIHVERQFDPSVLKKCLKAIKEVSC